jgi:glucose/arabinose dehydrogenase
MKILRWTAIGATLAGATVLLVNAGSYDMSDVKDVITGPNVFTDYKKEKPSTYRKITVADLPQPFATESAGNPPRTVNRPDNMWPLAPEGFKVEQFVDKNALEAIEGGSGRMLPRELRAAPNKDVFLADSGANKILILRGIGSDGKPIETSVFADTSLNMPFGVAFYPRGNNPQWVYVGNTDSVVRFPYKSGDLKAGGPAETIVASLPKGGGHWTRDLAFSPDGSKLFVAVGSASNIDDPDTHPTEFHRANILEFTPEGKFVEVYASGIRNPVGIAVNPTTGQLWCSVNERDGLGDNLVPDYITSVKEGGFYGWPFYYMGNHPDPRLHGAHPELASKVTVPDVLLQPHNASLEMMFYEGNQFPKQDKGDIFAAEHGSWNRSVRAGYEVIRVPLVNGKAAGVYEDFLTGFVTPEGDAWGRPVGIAAAGDGSLLVSDDVSKSVWRVIYTGK